MAENKNNLREIPKHNIKVDATVEDHSLLKDLFVGAYNTIIKPQVKGVVRDTISSFTTMCSDMVRNMTDGWLYPDGNVPNRKPNQSGHYTGTTNYTSFSRPIGQQQNQQRGRDPIGQRAGNEVKYIWVESEEKAKMITGALKEDIDNYGKAKVATLYEMVKERTTMADFTYGWTDANAIGYYCDTSRRPDENRWFIDLPKPIDITNI